MLSEIFAVALVSASIAGAAVFIAHHVGDIDEHADAEAAKQGNLLPAWAFGLTSAFLMWFPVHSALIGAFVAPSYAVITSSGIFAGLFSVCLSAATALVTYMVIWTIVGAVTGADPTIPGE
jgi:hypothetical protein